MYFPTTEYVNIYDLQMNLQTTYKRPQIYDLQMNTFQTTVQYNLIRLFTNHKSRILSIQLHFQINVQMSSDSWFIDSLIAIHSFYQFSGIYLQLFGFKSNHTSVKNEREYHVSLGISFLVIIFNLFNRAELPPKSILTQMMLLYIHN